MGRTAAILTLVAVVSLLGASDVRAGAALVPAGKTTGSTLTATIVTDVTDVSCTIGPDPTCDRPCPTCEPTRPATTKGQTTIRVQKASTSTAVMFISTYVQDINFKPDTCINIQFNDLVSSTALWFTGLIDGFIQNSPIQTTLIQPFGTPGCAAISSQDYVACTSMDDGRMLLSFTAAIVFKNPNFAPIPGCLP
jgi:hypothetical protein